MSMLQHLTKVALRPGGAMNRRSFIRRIAGGTLAAGTLSWLDVMTLKAAELRERGMSCILLWMAGGPSQFETFDPKPGEDTGGPTKTIQTALPGIEIAEAWPNVAKAMGDISLVRSMTNREGNHQRASYQLHTGYVPTGTVKHPAFGSIVASELGDFDLTLPHFVSVGQTLGPGFLGVDYAPFVVQNPSEMPANVTIPVSRERFSRRLSLLKRLQQDFAASGGKARVEDQLALYDRASQMVLSPDIKAFDLSDEKTELREAYGQNTFGQGCLLARRLVEAGVTFIEVRSNGWDTHQNNFDRTATLAAQVDPGFATLVTDLKQRGLLDKTLVIWMGEFGRTPRINGNTGRDHYPRAFNLAMAGAGIRGGRVIGKTSKEGTEVADRPVSVADLFCTWCHALKIDPRKENMSPLGRPIKLVDGGSPVSEFFS